MKRTALPDFKVLYSYSNEDYVVLVEGQTRRSKDQNENTEIDPHKYAHLFLKKIQKLFNGARTGFANGPGATGHLLT